MSKPEPTKEEIEKIRQNVQALLAKPSETHMEQMGALNREDLPTYKEAHGEDADYARSRFETARDDLFERHPMFKNPVSMYRQSLMIWPTMMTDEAMAISFDGERIYVSVDWFSDRSFEEIKFTVAWMGFLIARGHHAAGQARKDEEGFSHYHWNLAANLLVNRVITDAKAGVLPPVGAFITSIGNELNADTTIEEVYELIRPKSKLELNKMIWPLRDWSNWIDWDQWTEVLEYDQLDEDSEPA